MQGRFDRSYKVPRGTFSTTAQPQGAGAGKSSPPDVNSDLDPGVSSSANPRAQGEYTGRANRSAAPDTEERTWVGGTLVGMAGVPEGLLEDARAQQGQHPAPPSYEELQAALGRESSRGSQDVRHAGNGHDHGDSAPPLFTASYGAGSDASSAGWQYPPTTAAPSATVGAGSSEAPCWPRDGGLLGGDFSRGDDLEREAAAVQREALNAVVSEAELVLDHLDAPFDVEDKLIEDDLDNEPPPITGISPVLPDAIADQATWDEWLARNQHVAAKVSGAAAATLDPSTPQDASPLVQEIYEEDIEEDELQSVGDETDSGLHELDLSDISFAGKLEDLESAPISEPIIDEVETDADADEDDSVTVQVAIPKAPGTPFSERAARMGRPASDAEITKVKPVPQQALDAATVEVGGPEEVDLSEASDISAAMVLTRSSEVPSPAAFALPGGVASHDPQQRMSRTQAQRNESRWVAAAMLTAAVVLLGAFGWSMYSAGWFKADAGVTVVEPTTIAVEEPAAASARTASAVADQAPPEEGAAGAAGEPAGAAEGADAQEVPALQKSVARTAPRDLHGATAAESGAADKGVRVPDSAPAAGMHSSLTRRDRAAAVEGPTRKAELSAEAAAPSAEVAKRDHAGTQPAKVGVARQIESVGARSASAAAGSVEDGADDTGEDAPRSGARSGAAPAPARAATDAVQSSDALPEQPTSAEVQAAMAEVRERAMACVEQKGGSAVVQGTAVETGRVTHALILGQFSGTPEGSCLARAVRSARLPPFAGELFRFTYEMQL